ncbi:MAG: MerR family transcriptional regulator [Acidaminococcaceae bacterium]|nr:MerR family transcriptional regulator [Acidaminococcaceae bacterium]
MTITEVSEKYKIPFAVLQRYAAEKTGAEGRNEKHGQADSYRFTDRDIEELSVWMTLQDIGFAEEEIAAYLRMRQDGENSAEACLKMLNKVRSRTLDTIHGKEKALERIDYLRHELQTKKKGS